MDFFEAQARAKKRTSRLVVLFVLAVLGTLLATYAAALLIQRATGGDRPRHRGGYVVRAAAPLWQPRLFVGVSLATLAVVGIASLVKWSQFSAGGSAVAESVGGRRVDPRSTDLHERRLLNVVEEMAIASGVPVPAVYVLDDEEAINAFAAGLTTSDAVVAVTRGTLHKLNRDELQGVVAHEFSHILNGDMRLNMRLTALVFGILVLGLTGRGILWSMRNVRVRGKGGGGAVAGIALAGLALLIIGYIGYFFGRLVQAAVSRQREFLADASAVQFTRNPLGISGALKKIGGYALGSSLNSTKGEAIGHFFFAQGFRSMFGGLWATHPPLAERIRAIEPSFDGRFFEPPEVVAVERESFVGAGLAPAAPPSPAARLRANAALSAMGAVGTLTSQQIANAQELLEATPDRLRLAAREPAEAPALVFGLLLDADAAVRRRQLALVEAHAGTEAAQRLAALEPALGALRPEHRLPLLQLALPALREIPADELARFLAALDELVHADAKVSPFEFALQKLVGRTLALGEKPGGALTRYYSFNALKTEIATLLSVVAQASVREPAFAPEAFKAGAAHLKLIEAELQFMPAVAEDFAALEQALDKLAIASLPIKQRTLLAAAQVVGADGQVLVTELELLRAIAAALDVPMPPLHT
jgi:Zn-dependent protease with chaperone function